MTIRHRPPEVWLCVIYLIGQGIALHFTQTAGIASSFLLFDGLIKPKYAQDIVASLFVLVGGMLWGSDTRVTRKLVIATYGLWLCLALLASVRLSLFTAGWTVLGLLVFMYLSLIYEPEHLSHGKDI